MPASVTNAKVPTIEQASAGGVAYRMMDSTPEIAIVKIVPELRWQLPKGIVDDGETPAIAALREVREEAGIETELVGPIDTIEYWFFADYGKGRARYHKFVHFFLMRYRSGSVDDHDHEVDEARWVEIGEALRLLSFKNEREVVEKASEMIRNSTHKAPG